MNLYYFIGGPVPGQEDLFFKTLKEIGGTPSGWKIHPHADKQGDALHIITAESKDDIMDHLRHFEGFYQHSEIIEIVDRPRPDKQIEDAE